VKTRSLLVLFIRLRQHSKHTVSDRSYTLLYVVFLLILKGLRVQTIANTDWILNIMERSPFRDAH